MSDPAGLEDGRREGDGQSGNVKQKSDHSKWNMVWISGVVAAFYPSREDITQHANSPYFMACRSLLFLTFLADLALMLVTSCLLTLGRIRKCLYIAAKFLIYTTSILTMLTSVSLLLLLNPSYAKVAIIALPDLLIVILVFYKGLSTGQARNVTDYEAYLSELKPFFDLSASVTLTASAGMAATIFGYFKNFPTGVDQVDVKFSEAFMFFTVISGLLVMLLTTEPPSLSRSNARSRFITFIKVRSYSLFGLLALAVLAVAAEFSGLSIFLAFFPILLAVVVWFSVEFIQENGMNQAPPAPDHEGEPDTSSITITTFIFAVLMAVYSVYFGSEHNIDFHLQTCMFSMSSAFMCSLSWMLACRPPRTQSLQMAVMVLSYFSIGWSVVAILDVIFLMIRTG